MYTDPKDRMEAKEHSRVTNPTFNSLLLFCYSVKIFALLPLITTSQSGNVNPMQELEAFKSLLTLPKDIVITTHQKPDADALGSSLGMAAYLTKKGHRVQVIAPTDYPQFLYWMKGNDNVLVFGEDTEQQVARLVSEADVIFCLDFSSLGRINELGEMVRQSKASKVLIDHHLNPEDFADFVSWDTNAAATAELVYELIDALGDKHLIDKDLAECLYAGINTDTGGFRHPNTTQKVHMITAELIGLGADSAKVNKLIYDNNSLERLRFLGYALSEKLQVIEDSHVAYICITAEELQKFHSKTGDTEGLVNYALSIQGVKMAAMFVDRGGIVKMSFRSVGDFSVNEFAARHFEGGGHKNAAGGKSDLSLDETEARFRELVQEYKEQLRSSKSFLTEYA